MSMDECNAIIESYNEQYKNGWEQTRYIAFINAALYNDKIKKPSDLMKFDWDDEDNNPIISREERIKREQEMLEWLNTHVNK